MTKQIMLIVLLTIALLTNLNAQINIQKGCWLTPERSLVEVDSQTSMILDSDTWIRVATWENSDFQLVEIVKPEQRIDDVRWVFISTELLKEWSWIIYHTTKATNKRLLNRKIVRI